MMDEFMPGLPDVAPMPSSGNDRGPTVIWSMWMMVAVCFTFVAARLYTRTMILHNMGWDDYLLVGCWLINVLFSTFCTLAVGAGMGRHMGELKPSEVVDTLKLTTIAQSFGILSAGLIKITLGAFLLRIIIKPWQRICVWVPMVVVMFMSSLCIICLWLQKTPVESVYNPYIVKFKINLDQTKLSLVVSAIWILTDFYYAAFPWVFMWNLQMKFKEKATIAGGLSLGVIAGACGIVRTIKLENLAAEDFSYLVVDPIIWTAGEFCLTLITSSVVVLFPLYKQVFGIVSSRNAGPYSNQLPDESSYPMGSKGGFRSKSDFTSSATPKCRGVTTTEVGADDSDDSILGSTRRSRMDGIKKTYAVDVEYGDAASQNSRRH